MKIFACLTIWGIALLFCATWIPPVSSGFLDFLHGKRPTKVQTNCNEENDPGPCRAAFEKYYWDSELRDCQVFYYGGCAGNGNRFNSYAECKRKCGRGKRKIVLLEERMAKS